ncbi:protein phosphatase 2C domain-containing protein [Adhaeribacter swui]|uniref:Protein phosphatase 2C domain-containing protein n=1 Tax=Adhaeribacter swui TaxID=2086471 RepID=A0A7G7GC35_9BACT|nr:protein phosphatase 2C domain-containing protein [Adhaeribacter swui]QNF34719.1 protein phosphatase 2C domain-containing protein [Adhaeribacter swui]
MHLLVVTTVFWLLFLPGARANQANNFVRELSKKHPDSASVPGKKNNSAPVKKQNQDSVSLPNSNPTRQNLFFLKLATPSDFTIRLEPLENASGLPITDSMYVLLPRLTTNQKLPVVYKLRLIGQDSGITRNHDYRLIMQANHHFAKPQSVTSQTLLQARWQAQAAKNIAIQFSKANLTAITPAGAKDSQNDLVDKKSFSWQPYAFLLSALLGVFGLLWVASRFLVFSVKLSPAKKKFFKKSKPDLPASAPTELLLHNNATTPTPKPAVPSLRNNYPAEPLLSTPDTESRAQMPDTQFYFFTELLLTAGPRKKYMSDPEADKDLGEDVCGFVALRDQLLLWVLDGTSDQYCLRHPHSKKEYFSSRLLAQSVANKLRIAYAQVATLALDKWLSQAVAEVKEDWLQSVQALPLEEQEILRTNILNKNIPECATTILFGTLTLTGHLVAYRSGDCKMVLYTRHPPNQLAVLETSLHQKNESSNDRLFFRLVLDAAGGFEILHNSPRFEIVEQDQVCALAAFSDGIGPETETHLQALSGKTLDTIRQDLIYQLQGTDDDKVICFVEIREWPEINSNKSIA